MFERCCANCVYSKALTTKWLRILVMHYMPGLMLCFNCANCPGQIAEVFFNLPACRNFRPRHGPWGKRGDPPRPAKDGTCFIILTQGEVAMVDPEDFEELNKHVWCAHRNGRSIHVCRRVGRQVIWMHRVIMKAPKGMIVDHIDGNGLNNRKCNLRICTREQNSFNVQPRGGACGFKGVAYDKRSGKYKATIGYRYDHIEIGQFDDPVDAARARDMVARELQGEHAWLNLPEEIGDRPSTGPGTELVSGGPSQQRPVSEEVLRAVQSAIVRARRKHPPVRQAERPGSGS